MYIETYGGFIEKQKLRPAANGYGELDLPLLTTDLRLRRAAQGSAQIEVLQGVERPDRT